MRFAHLSDSHLGYRQLGILEREEDFYRLFERTIDKIIELDVDFVIHSGDLFDNYRPSTDTLLTFQRALVKLNQANIPFYAIVGNHDSRLRKNAKPPLLLFRDFGVKLITTKNPQVHEGILICGVPYSPSSQNDALRFKLRKLSGLANKYSKSILVLHQGIKGFLRDEAGELKLKDLPRNFDYYAMGHLHNYRDVDFSEIDENRNGILVYPGSMEIHNLKDDPNKGFCVVDISEEKPKVERVLVDLERKVYNISIDYKDFEDTLYNLKNEIKNLDKPPIVDFKVENGGFDTSEVFEIIQEELGDYVLNLRTHLDPKENDDSKIDFDPNEPLDLKSVLFSKINEKYDEDTSRLSVDLLEVLSKGNIEDAIHLSNDFFNKYYFNLDEEFENKPNIEKASDSKNVENKPNIEKDNDDRIVKNKKDIVESLDKYF